MIAGFALGPAGVGLTAMQAGLASAAIGTALTGDLKQGLMAGLGAYSGAGLGQGLMAQGAQGAAGAGAGLNPAAAGQVGLQAPSQVFGANAAGMADDVALANYRGFGPNAGGMGLSTAAPSGLQLNAMSPAAAAAVTPPPSVVPATTTPPASDALDDFFNAKYGQGSDMGTRRVIDLVEPPSAVYKPQPSQTFNMPSGATGWSGNSQLGYKYYGPGGDPIGSAFPAQRQLPPIESRVPTPVERGVVRSEVYPGAPDPSIPVRTYTGPVSDRLSQLGRGAKASFSSMEGLKGLYAAMPEYSAIASGITLASALKPKPIEAKKDKSLIRPYEFTYGATGVDQEPYTGSGERLYFNPQYTALTPYEAPGPEYAAEGGLMGYAVGGPVEQMSAMNSVGMNTGYPMANINTPVYANPMMQRPEATNVIAPSADAGVGAYSGEARFAGGGISHLGDYSDGGRLLKGPGDGVSDSIPASIGGRQPARLADGEFVVPARIVSEIGNGSTEAGARKLYAMMDRVQKARRKTVGKGQVARNTKAEKLLPA